MKRPDKQENPWAQLSTLELRNKRAELKALVDNDILSDRSLENQHAEIGIIENELARRDEQQ